MHFLENDADLRAENALLLPQAVLECLQDALRAGVLQHDCHRSATTFAYSAYHQAALPQGEFSLLRDVFDEVCVRERVPKSSEKFYLCVVSHFYV